MTSMHKVRWSNNDGASFVGATAALLTTTMSALALAMSLLGQPVAPKSASSGGSAQAARAQALSARGRLATRLASSSDDAPWAVDDTVSSSGTGSAAPWAQGDASTTGGSGWSADTSGDDLWTGEGDQGWQGDDGLEAVGAATLTQTLDSVDGHNYTVTVEYGEEAGVPQGSTLRLAEVNQALGTQELELEENQGRPYDTERFVDAAQLADRAALVREALELEAEDRLIQEKYLDVTIVDPYGDAVVPQADVSLTVGTDAIDPSAAAAVELAVLSPQAIKAAGARRSALAEAEAATTEEERNDANRRAGEAWSQVRRGETVWALEPADESTEPGVARVGATTDELGSGELALVVVASPVFVWEDAGTKVTFLGARYGLSLSEHDAAAPQLAEGAELLDSFGFAQSPAPAFGTTLWVEAAQTLTDDGAVCGYAVQDGVPTQLFGGWGTTTPVAFRADEQTMAIAWEPTAPEPGADQPAGGEGQDSDTGDYQPDGGEATPGTDDQGKDDAPPADDRPAQDAGVPDGSADDKPADAGAPVATRPEPVADPALTLASGAIAAPAGGPVTLVEYDEARTYRITVKYGPESGLPEGVALRVRELEGAERLELAARASEAAGAPAASLRAFDISFVDGAGREVEPTGPVDVRIHLTDGVERDGAKVAHFPDAPAAEAELVDARATGTARGTRYDFTAEGFSVYAVFEVVVEQTVTASDGSAYLVSVTYDSASGVPMDAVLGVTEIARDSADYASYVKRTAEALGKDADHLAAAHAFDISLIDPSTGEHCQPTRPVAVSIKLLQESIQEDDTANVVHFPGSSEGEVLDASINGDAFEFKSSSFSVYVVSKDQRGYIYKFMSPEPERAEYTQLRQTVFDGDVLVKPVAPSEYGRVFSKWVWRGLEGTDENFSDFNGWGEISVPNTQRGMVEVEVTAEFTDENHRQHHILFNDQDENIYNQITYRAGTLVDPNGTEGDTNKVSYVAIQKKTGQYLTFGYWTEDLYDLDATTGKPKPFQAENIDRDISLYPYCPQAHWLYFDVNRAQAGDQSLAFVPPVIILEGEVPETAKIPTANGYVFDGWWTKADGGYQIYDENGELLPASEQRLKPGSSTETFDYEYELRLYTGGDSLDYDPTLYAHWTAKTTASYTVSYWVQRATDAVDATNEEKKYDFYTMHTFQSEQTAAVGSTVGITGSGADTMITPYTAAQVVAGTAVDPSGLKLNTTNSHTETVATDGSTSLKVYYDRKDYTIRFGSGTSANSFGTEYNDYTIHELYGHDIEDQWGSTNNPNTGNTTQWRKLKNINSNVTILFVMPAVESMSTDEAYYSSNELRYIRGAALGNGTKYTYDRNAYLENVNDNGYTENPSYRDRRVFTNGPGNVAVQGGILSAIDGFTLIRVEGSGPENYASTANYQYVNNLANRNTSIANYTTDATKQFRYYGSSSPYQVKAFYKRNTNQLMLRYKVDGVWANDIVASDAPVSGATVSENGSALTWSAVKYGASISNYLYDYVSNHQNLSNVKNSANAWWFWDEGLTNPVSASDLATMTMPDYPVILYEGLRTSYHVDVDPQGGELDGVTQRTYFNVGKDEAIGEYVVSRDYVEWSELYESRSDIPAATKLYKYVYNTRDNDDGTHSAKYVEMTAEERADDNLTAYVYYPGLWQFQYWYEEGKPSEPFDFVTPPNNPVTLLAKWVHAGNYSIVYNANSGGRSYRVPKDSELYLEGSEAVIKPSVDQPGNKQFRFWATKPQTSDSLDLPAGAEKFLPNERLTVDAKYTPGQLEQTERTITLYAWYEGGSFTADSFADYEFYLPESTGTWLDGQPEGEENQPYYVQTISPGETLIMPPLPTGANAPTGTFIGWYEDPLFKERFTGFGEISTPVNHKLYARFAEVHTVIFREPGNDNPRTISVQTYFDGDLLSTLGVEFTTTTDKYVSHWAADNGVNYSYMGKGVELSNPGTAYDPTDAAKNGHVKTNLVLTPVTENVYNLSFDSQGGAYVAPIEMPHDITRWVAEPLTTREAFSFEGWFTAPKGQTNEVYPGVEGGVQYEFNKPLTQWAADPDGDPSTEAAIDLTHNNPLRLYAHWLPTGDPIPTTVKVNYWIQNAERSGYFLWSSETVAEHGTGSNAGNKIAVGDTYALTDAQKSTDKIAGYETFPDGNDAADDRAYFELSSTASGEDDEFVSYATETSKTAAEGGVTTLNVYFNRKLYTLRFAPDRTYVVSELVAWKRGNIAGTNFGDINQNITYSIDGNVFLSDPETYQISAWLGKDIGSAWPQYKATNSDVTIVSQQHSSVQTETGRSGAFYWTSENYSESSWLNTYYFRGWTEYKGTSTTTGNKNSQFENVAAAQSYIGRNLLPDPAQSTYTLQAEYVADSDPEDSKVTVHYMLKKPGVTGVGYTTDNYYEASEYEQTLYGITGNPGSYSNDTWNKILGQATPIDGYEREDFKEAKAINETVYIPLYRYDLPNETYFHRFGDWGNLLYARIYVAQNAHTGTSTDSGHPRGSGVREGQYSLLYRYIVGPPRALSNTSGVYEMDPDALFHNSFEVLGVMSVTDLRAILEASKTQTGWDQVTYKGNHVYLYYEMQSYPLTLKSAETEAELKTATVQYSTYLTNENGTLGYIRASDGMGYTPPSVPGRSFVYWSLSKDSTAAWEGVMPNQPFELWAHYEDTKVTVTALGVEPNGALRRNTDDAKTILRDANGLPASWGEDEDSTSNDFVSLQKTYGTRFQEFELPIPSLESGEIFYGWKRVENGKMVGGYLSNTQAITGDIVVAPDIAVNKGGSVAYYANGATNEGLTTETKYDEEGFLFEEGGFYFGATAKAKVGTVSGAAPDATNPVLTNGSFNFVCWNTRADGGGDSYYPSDSIALPDTGVVKLYAQYASKREITLVYHINVPGDYDGDEDAPGFVKMPLAGAFTEDVIDQGLNGTAGIESENGEKVLKITFKDYLEDSSKYPNSQYPSSVDSEGNAFITYCPGHTFLHWNTAPDGTDETSLRTDDVRINTLGKDANGEIHLYAQWETIVLPVQVYEVTPGHIEDQFRLRVVNNTGSATHIDAGGNSSNISTPVGEWGNPYNSYLKSNSTRSASALETAVTWYMADVRHGVDPKDSYLKSVLSTNEDVQINYVRFDTTLNKWQYSSSEATSADSVASEDWLDFNLGDELKIFYERPQYMVFFNYNGGTDADGREYRGESAEAAFSGTDTAEMSVINDVSRNGFELVGWSMGNSRADLSESAAVPNDADFYAVDLDDSANSAKLSLSKSGSGDTLTFRAGREGGTTVRLYQTYADSQTNHSLFYAVWRVSPWVCQITSVANRGEEGETHTLLYYRTAGTAAAPRAWAEAKFTSLKNAYNALGMLYTKNGDNYVPYNATGSGGNDTNIEMLVGTYNLQTGDDFLWTNNYKLTLTTASTVTSTCEIIRGSVGANFNILHCDLTLEDITINNSGRGGGDGGIFDLKHTDSKLTLNNGSTLYNGKALSHGGAVDVENGQLIMNDGALIRDCDGNDLGGGAVFLHTGASFVMNGGKITDCKSNRGGAVYCSADNAYFEMNGGIIENCRSMAGFGHGGAVDIEDGSFTMNGGTIKNCTAKHNGGAIHIHARDVFTMNGGLITGCSAEGNGSVIYINDGTATNPTVVTLTGGTITGNAVSDDIRAINFNGPYCRLNISGNPVVYGNVTAGGVQRNIDLTDVRDNQVNNIITVNGALSADARIGVYAPDGHDEIGEQFGNYLNGISTDNFSIFKNDKDRYLVGVDGGSKKLVWGPVICKIVDTDDQDEHVFTTLNDAVDHARAHGNGTAMGANNPVKIEMLVDYVIPEDDKVALNQATDNITFTTAATEGYYYVFIPSFTTAQGRVTSSETVAEGVTIPADGNGTAILKRGFADGVMIESSGSSILTTRNIIFDGSKASYSGGPKGGAIYAHGDQVYLYDTVIRNSKSEGGASGDEGGGGGAYLDCRVSVVNGGRIVDCESQWNGGGICFNHKNTTNYEKAELNGVQLIRCNAAPGNTTTDKKGRSGGGAYFWHRDGRANCVTFVDCHADSDKGGGLYFYGAHSELGVSYKAEDGSTVYGDSNFINCSALRGGGVQFYEVHTTSGGAEMPDPELAEGEEPDEEVDGTTQYHVNFKNCEAKKEYGGGAAFVGEIKNVSYMTFDGCTAYTNGGGLGAYGGTTSGATLDHLTFTDCTARTNGGAIYLEKTTVKANDAAPVLSNITIDGHDSSKASPLSATTKNAASGGGIYVKTGEVVLQDCVLLNSYATNGGAIYAMIADGATKPTTVNLSDAAHPNTITGNTASSAGAGIYLANNTNNTSIRTAILRLAGAQNFGGAGVDAQGDLSGSTVTVGTKTVAAGNFVTGSSMNSKLNGGRAYLTGKARQDVYIAEVGAEGSSDPLYAPAAIVVTGDLASSAGTYIGDGTIWVWANDQYRYKQLMPFAKMGTGVQFVEGGAINPTAGKYDAAHLKAFRNARDDETTENGTDTYLYGTTEGDVAGIVYWSGVSGSKRVILRKVDTSLAPVPGLSFKVYKGMATSPYIVKGADGTRTQLGGESAATGVVLDPMTSHDNGVIWAGDLPFGWYIIEETSPHRYFYVVVTANGTYETPAKVTEGGSEKVGGFENLANAQTAAKAVYDANK